MLYRQRERPKERMLSEDGKPLGKGWVDQLADTDGWNRENQFL